jgi:hypothetical protein
MTCTDGQPHDASADNVVDRRQARRPPIPAGAQTEHRNIDEQGTMYVPTSLSVEGLFYVDDACPMRYDVVNEDTYLEFGAANLALSLMCSDQALIDIAHLANGAVRAMLHARGMPATDPVIDREPN